MDGIEITLPQMLDCRERRNSLQNEMLRRYGKPVISFCMNIPGPVKTNPQICAAFMSGKRDLTTALRKHGYAILQETELHEATGDEWIAAVDAEAGRIKELTTEIENRHPAGRLFDMDVIASDGNKLSRGSFRKCLLCDKQAQECARSRTHSVQEMQEAVERILLRLPAPVPSGPESC
ncbi:MAG: citrate lyase holo-[Blautia sp.]|nr:citrate lyase holo-[acyl-carrier protein] synthase [Blautia sp.]